MNTTRNNASHQHQGTAQPPKPPKVGRPDGLAPSLKEAPEDVRWAVLAWVITAGLQILYALVQFAANAVDSRTLYSQVKQQMEGDGGGLNLSQLANLTGNSEQDSINQVVMMTNVMMTLWMVLAAVICAWLATRAGRGGNYSRMFLSVGSVYLALTGLLAVFSSAPATMNVGLALLSGILTILSGVVAVVGLYFITRPGNAEWLGVPSAKQVEEYRKEFMQYQEQVEAEKKAKKEAKEQQKEQQKEKQS